MNSFWGQFAPSNPKPCPSLLRRRLDSRGTHEWNRHGINTLKFQVIIFFCLTAGTFKFECWNPCALAPWIHPSLRCLPRWGLLAKLVNLPALGWVIQSIKRKPRKRKRKRRTGQRSKRRTRSKRFNRMMPPLIQWCPSTDNWKLCLKHLSLVITHVLMPWQLEPINFRSNFPFWSLPTKGWNFGRLCNFQFAGAELHGSFQTSPWEGASV